MLPNSRPQIIIVASNFFIVLRSPFLFVTFYWATRHASGKKEAARDAEHFKDYSAELQNKMPTVPAFSTESIGNCSGISLDRGVRSPKSLLKSSKSTLFVTLPAAFSPGGRDVMIESDRR